MHTLQASLPWVVILSTIVIVIISLGLIILFLVFQNKRQRHIKETIDLKDEFANTLLQSKMEIQEQTLQHISRELHDNLGQIASLIKINLNTLQYSHPEKTKEQIEDTKELTRRLITDLKLLSLSIGNDNILHNGLSKGIENELERLKKTGRFETSLEEKGYSKSLNNRMELILYRIFQELLNNTLKHSLAKKINVILEETDTHLILIVTDDGIGFDVSSKIKSGGSGLRNIQTRAALIEADLKIDSQPTKGTSIHIKVPLCPTNNM